MTQSRGGGKETLPLFQAWRQAGRQAGWSQLRTEMKEMLCFIRISFDPGPECQPAAGLGENKLTTFGGRWGKNTHHFLARVFFPPRGKTRSYELSTSLPIYKIIHYLSSPPASHIEKNSLSELSTSLPYTKELLKCISLLLPPLDTYSKCNNNSECLI